MCARLVLVIVGGLLGVACGPTITGFEDAGLDADEEGDEAFVAPLPEMTPYDYRSCGQGAIVAPCDGGECVDPGVQPLSRRFTGSVARLGLADYVELSEVRVDADYTGDVVIGYQVHVGWVRAGRYLRFPADSTLQEQGAEIDDELESLELPLTLAAPEAVRDALRSCLPDAAFDPCTAFETAGTAAVLSVSWYARVDTKTATLVQCGPD